MSTYDKEMQITQAVLDQAEADAPQSGYDTSKFYTIERNSKGSIDLVNVDNSGLDASIETQATDENGVPLVDENGNPMYVGVNAASVFVQPTADRYDGYLTEDGLPPNGTLFSASMAFPTGPVTGQFHMRTDYHPNRLFRFNGTRWVKFEDNLRMTMSNLSSTDVESGNRFEGKEARKTQKTEFINNDNTDSINGKVIKEKQSLSKALRPKADD
jgi:hypothetical protein